jgi:mutator protein MutT|tara:strand:- start:998 stop:1435 length:438 start_codon:yes stop_codon:yes gene_type:complete
MKESIIKAAGGCIIAKDTHRILLQQRTLNGSFPRNWGFFGGKVEANENVAQALLRELTEEIALSVEDDIIKIYPLDQYHTRNGEFSYYSFAILVEKEFIPSINHESGGYAWVDTNYIPKPLHPGTRRTLFRKKKLKIIKDIISSL